jgi:hypothetical protein
VRLAKVFIVLVSLTNAQAGMLEEHLRLIAHPGPGAGCANDLAIRGILPNGHGEDRLHADDVLSTVLVTDLLHMNRLFHVMERFDFSLTHSEPLRRLDPQRTGYTPQRMIRNVLAEYEKRFGAAYVNAAFGGELFSILETDNEQADTTSALMKKLQEVMRRMAYAVKYHYTWRLVFMDLYPDVVLRGNRTFAQCMNEWRATHAEPVIEEMLTDVSAQTETELLKDRSGMFAPTDVARRPLSLANWNKRFPTRHLPEIGKRTVEYLRMNWVLGSLGPSAVYLGILDDLSMAVEKYDQLVEAARGAETEPVHRLANP